LENIHYYYLFHHIYNYYTLYIQEVNKDERKLGGKQNNAAVPLLVSDNGDNLVVEQTSLADNWNVLGSKTEVHVILYTVVSVCHSVCILVYISLSITCGRYESIRKKVHGFFFLKLDRFHS